MIQNHLNHQFKIAPGFINTYGMITQPAYKYLFIMGEN
jgi:hypothetical protein